MFTNEFKKLTFFLNYIILFYIFIMFLTFRKGLQFFKILRWQLWIQIASTGMIIMKSLIILLPIVDHIGVDLIMKLLKKIT